MRVRVSLIFWKEVGIYSVFRMFPGFTSLRRGRGLIRIWNGSLSSPQPRSASPKLFPDPLEQGVVFLVRNTLSYSTGLSRLSDSK